MRSFLFAIGFMLSGFALYAQDTCFIKIHFLYGSKPGKGYKNIEGKYFGGIHGGHVTVEIGDTVIGFNPTRGARIFPKKSHSNGGHHIEQPLVFTYDSTDSKQTTITIPVTREQLNEMRALATQYLSQKPYDYALLGMRCASSAHEFLSTGGVFKERTKLFSIFYNFYPKKLRKRVLDKAFENGWEILHQEGRVERKWEGDKKRHREKLKKLAIVN